MPRSTSCEATRGTSKRKQDILVGGTEWWFYDWWQLHQNSLSPLAHPLVLDRCNFPVIHTFSYLFARHILVQSFCETHVHIDTLAACHIQMSFSCAHSPVSVAHHGDEEVDQQNCHNHDEHEEFHLNTLQIMMNILGWPRSKSFHHGTWCFDGIDWLWWWCKRWSPCQWYEAGSNSKEAACRAWWSGPVTCQTSAVQIVHDEDWGGSTLKKLSKGALWGMNWTHTPLRLGLPWHSSSGKNVSPMKSID